MAGAEANEAAAEKKSLHAAEQDSEEGRLRRQAWQQQIARIESRRLVFLDETGTTTEMTRRYGRAFRRRAGARSCPGRTLADAYCAGGHEFSGPDRNHGGRGPTDREVLLAYLEQVLCPQLEPGQVVVMDNLSSHKVAGVRELIQAARAELLYLPPYSPDFNPMEKCWAKLKQRLRALKARSLDLLQQAIAEAIPTISNDNAAAWFRHCGYPL